jgi:signal transduction histidine kinase
MALDLEDVNVALILEAAVVRWSGDAGAGGVRLTSAGPDDLGLMRGDPRRLSQVLDHLILNALGQTPKGGRITLTARRTLGEVQIQVTDTGRGIPFHVQANIFDRFIGRERGGPGLGLALVKALVELHGGWVSLESEPGSGATFTCHLPEKAEGAAGHPELEF